MNRGTFMQNYEILGHFYLGKAVDPATMTRTDQYLMYDSKDLSTHAICVGMTGSGKTGLGIDILEEAAMDNIPALIIDPKGDMTNLMLTFPDLKAEDFLPWLHSAEAERKNMNLEEFATAKAEQWRNGLAEWQQDGERIRTLREKAQFSVYTPGSSAGKPLSVLRMLNVPDHQILQDQEAVQDYAAATVSALLALLGINADPLQSREHILLSNILLKYWQNNQNLNLETLIKLIAEPGIAQIGVMPLDIFYPQNDRMQLAMRFNNLLASPQFSSWLQGEPMDIQNLLYTAEGKPRISILAINHLDEQERMFFVSTFLNQVLAWTRSQSGTSSLRAILYMDEIFGYFPPVANPPSKKPLLSLLKQARAFGLGIVLATQNPVDLDYKGLANIGTWFIGRLQTEQDKERLLDGLQTASLSNSEIALQFNRKELSDLLSSLPARTFLLNNVHESGPILFETRWCMSYLAGPLTKQQIALFKQSITQTDQQAFVEEQVVESSSAEIPITDQVEPSIVTPAVSAGPALSQTAEITETPEEIGTVFDQAPKLPTGVDQYYLAPFEMSSELTYLPSLYAYVETSFEDLKLNISSNQTSAWNTLLKDSALTVDWSDQTGAKPEPNLLALKSSVENAAYSNLPATASTKGAFTQWSRELIDQIYRNDKYTVYANQERTVISEPDENQADFIIRLRQANREARDQATADLKEKYEKKIATLSEKVRKAEQTVERKQEQAKQAKFSTFVSLGNTLLDTFVGRKGIGKGTLGKAATSARSAGRANQQSGEVARAEDSLTTYQTDLENLETELERELELLTESYDAKAEQYEEVEIKPKKKDILLKVFGVLWLPFEKTADNQLRPLFEIEDEVDSE